MAEAAWSTFYPDVLVHVPGCPYPLVDHHLRVATIELCQRSKRLKFDMPAFDTVADTPTYPLAPGTKMETVSIIDAAVAGKPIDPATRSELSTGDDWSTETGQPTKYLMDGDDETVRLWKMPDAAYTVILTLAIKPAEDATGVEQWFADRYRRTIARGALAELLALPKQPWTDLNMAAIRFEQFEEGVRAAEAQGLKDGTSAPLRTTRYGTA